MAMSIKERREEFEPLKQSVANLAAAVETLAARIAAIEAQVHPVIDPQFAEMEGEAEEQPKGGKKRRAA